MSNLPSEAATPRAPVLSKVVKMLVTSHIGNFLFNSFLESNLSPTSLSTAANSLAIMLAAESSFFYKMVSLFLSVIMKPLFAAITIAEAPYLPATIKSF